jgi:hypothetical protein
MAGKRIIVYKVIEEPPKSDLSDLCAISGCGLIKSKDGFCKIHHPSKYCSFDGCNSYKSWWSPKGGFCKEHEPDSFYDYKHPGIYPKHLRFVYLMYSNRLNALKIGIGQYGRIEQLKRSEYINSDTGLKENALWYVLKVGRFSTLDEQSNDSLPKFIAAEKRVLNYWHAELGLKPHLTPTTMGFLKGTEKTLGGSSETVKLGSVCEVETWKQVQLADGYLGDRYIALGLDMTPRSRRPLRCSQPNHAHS